MRTKKSRPPEVIHPFTGEYYEGMTELAEMQPAKSSDGKHYKSKGLLLKLLQRQFKTPDFASLRMFKEIPVLCYGVDMTNGEAHHLLKGANYYGKGHTVSNKFLMKEGPRYPVVFEVGESNLHKNKIRGEVYGVDVRHIHMLDEFFDNGRIFKRTKRNIFMEGDAPPGTRKLNTAFTTPAYIYLGRTVHWKDVNMKNRYTTRYGGGKFAGMPFFEFTNLSYEEEEMALWGYPIQGYADEAHIG
jgi:gamma-glutamylcyclotransferase (GGCT)/AIG2-like uncharacterized protein YtfP